MVAFSAQTYVLIILTLTLIQGHTHNDLNHGNNKSLVISETIQAIPIGFPVKIVRLKVYYNYDHGQSEDLDPKSQLRIKLDKCLTCIL